MTEKRMNIERAINVLDSLVRVGYEEYDIALTMSTDIMKMIKECDEKSASKCWECINLIKEKY
jgi:hypothetical protein